MSWNLDSSRPIYAQIIEKVSLDIVSGKYQPGDKTSFSQRFSCSGGSKSQHNAESSFRIRKREPGSFRKNKRAIYYRGQSYD